jgi:hypothetical protein
LKFHAKQIRPPKNWEEFERLCLHIFRGVWSDPLAEMHGRRGQAQQGVDVYSSPLSLSRGRHGVQCKGKDQGYGGSVDLAEVEAEIAKADTFTPPLTHWILATTAPRDAALQRDVRSISDARAAAGLFTVQVLAWEDLQDLIAGDQSVLEEFYEEHAFDIKGLIKAVQALGPTEEIVALRDRLNAEAELPTTVGCWTEVAFETRRGFGPALLGQGLGPADAAACPRLIEADQILRRLEVGYSARLVGAPGAGKSVTAYQAAEDLARKGWRVWRLDDPQASVIPLPPGSDTARTLVLMDDVHLMPPTILRRFEDRATDRFGVISTQNVVDGSAQPAGSIALDAKRAVETIARGLLARRAETLAAVRRADDHVGDRYMDEDLEQRIRLAEQEADRPWQFCFILGGGWRRAREAAANARAAGADLVLAAIAARQIGSRDARANLDDIHQLASVAGVAGPDVTEALRWLAANRLILSAQDLRCPHQQFALKVLEQIIEGQDEAGRDLIVQACRVVMTDGRLSLGGASWLVTEMKRMDRFRWRATALVDTATLDALTDRAWAADTPEDISHAANLLVALEDIEPGWPASTLRPHIDQLGRWLSTPADPSGSGLSNLINNVYNTDKDFAGELVASADPLAFGRTVSSSTPEDVFTLARLLDRMMMAASDAWIADFHRALDRRRLMSLAPTWPIERLWSLSELIEALHHNEPAFAIDLLEAALPLFIESFRQDPFRFVGQYNELFWFVLQVATPFGGASGLSKGNSQRAHLARQILGAIEPSTLAHRFSNARRRDLRGIADILIMVRIINPTQFRRVVRLIDWPTIEATIGDDWTDLRHEDLNAICIPASDKVAKAEIEKMLQRRARQMKTVDPRIIALAPDIALRAYDAGAKLALGRGMTFSWSLIAYDLHLIAKRNPEAAVAVAGANTTTFVAALERNQANCFEGTDVYIEALREYAPGLFEQALDQVDPTKAEKGWATCLRAGAKARRSAGVLVAAALDRPGEIAEVGKRLRQRFPALKAPKADTPSG